MKSVIKFTISSIMVLIAFVSFCICNILLNGGWFQFIGAILMLPATLYVENILSKILFRFLDKNEKKYIMGVYDNE